MEKAVLVGIKFDDEALPLSESLEELKKLAETAGASACGSITQSREKPDQKYFIGTGKLKELEGLCLAENADMVIFDHSISPSQCRNLEEALGIKVVDRTELILDIFAQHAHSREGKLQVELAQSNFLMTRLTGKGIDLSRLGGGIGTRGPGETKLEVDRRKTRKQIALLRKELEKVKSNRQLLRSKRKSSKMKVAALIGYTNSGKSTLLNSLTKAGVLSEDKLFATLDPVTRRLYLKSGQTILITDTVGFIQKLPHQLVEAFRATLEETIEADLLLHVIDASSPWAEHQIEAVRKTLEEIGAKDIPVLNVFNKTDKGSSPKLYKKYSPYVEISALNKTGLDKLLEAAADRLGNQL